MQMLPQALVIYKKESLVGVNGPSQRCSELVPLEGRCRSLVEVVRGVENIVTKELINAAVEFVCSGLRHNRHLPARSFTVLGAIRVAKHVEFSNCINAEQLLAAATGLHVVFGRAR